jgi:hypothetical protein
MGLASGTIARAREIMLVTATGLALALAMTWPLVTDLGGLGRTLATDADGQFSIWNVSWVARTIVADPLHLFDANIFHPHKLTLAYSEANLLPGVIGMPVYWMTRNPWLTENVVLLFGFTSAYLAAFLLLRHLTGDAAAAAVAAVLYAFCPYVFSHLSHIQLLMTGGVPLAMLAMHRFADEVVRAPSDPLDADRDRFTRALRRRSLWLGLALTAQALSCAYYGIFAALMVGFATLLFAVTRRLWRSTPYWIGIAAAAAISIVIVLPFFIPYLRVQAESGFARTVEDAMRFSARPHGYLASSANAHRWLLDVARGFGPWGEVLFPGILALTAGLAGIVIAARRSARDRETAMLYGTLGVLAFWASFGPAAGLYSVLSLLPAFSFLRAPSRLGLVVVLCLVIFAAFTLSAVFDRAGRRRIVVAVLAGIVAIAELAIVPLRWYRAPELPGSYKVLAASPRGVLAEFPFYGARLAYPLHAQYMLFSTAHWMPMINGYSDVIPADFRESASVLSTFPSDDALRVLARRRVRYIAIHWDMFEGGRQDDVRERLRKYLPFLRLLAQDDRMTIYEVLFYPI